jgi:hypothetical protein
MLAGRVAAGAGGHNVLAGEVVRLALGAEN